MKIGGVIAGWVAIVALVAVSALTGRVSLWLPAVVYVAVVGSRAYQKVGDYRDWVASRYWEEQRRINQAAEDAAEKGMAQSGARAAAEVWMQDEFKRERRAKYRDLVVGLAESLLMK